MISNNFQEYLIQKIDHFLDLNRNNTNQKDINLQSQELTALTKNQEFINIAHKILVNFDSNTRDKKDKETLITSLLKDKFKYQFQTIANNVEKHYRQLVEIAKTLYVCSSIKQNSGYATYTNIALSLAYTYIHLLALQPTDLQVFISPLIPNDQAHVKLYNYYFKTLEYIATEIDNTKFVIDDLQRDIAHERLISMQLSILQYFQSIANGAFQAPHMNKQNILYCFQAWITVHNNPEVLNSLPDHFLFKKVIQNIQDEECGEAAGNCLRSVIYQLKNEQENKKMFQTLSTCCIQILGLIDQYLGSVEYDKAEDFVRIVSDFARKSRKLFVANYDRNIDAFLRKLIVYLGDDLMNTYESVADVFEGIIKQIRNVNQEGRNVNPDIYGIFDPLYDSLCHKCAMPARMIKELNHTDMSKAHHISSMAEEIISHRDFTDIIFEELSKVQGKAPYLHFVVSKMKLLDYKDEQHFWSKLQIYLFSLEDAVEEYPQIDQQAVLIIQTYIELMKKQQPMPICLRRSFLNVFRGLTTSTIKNEELMYRIMCLSINQFTQPLVFHVAQKTFQKACEQYKHMAINIFNEFGKVLQQYPSKSYVVRGVFSLICNQEKLIQQFYIKALNFLFQKFQHEPEKSKRKQFMHSIIQGLKALKDSSIGQRYMHLVVKFLKDNWDFIIQVLSNPQRVKDDEDPDVQKMVRIIKVAMRTLQFHFSQFLENMFTNVLTAFEKYPICSYVYLVQVTVTIFSANPAYNDYLRNLYSTFCDIAFKHMNEIKQLTRFSYLLDDYMGMNKRFFVHNASIVLSSGKLPLIIETAVNFFFGCDIPRIAKAAYSFFQTIFMVYWPPQHLQHRNSKEDITPINPKPEDAQNYQELKHFLIQKLGQIISKMLEHLGRAPTQQTRDYIIDALVSEIKAFIPQNPSVWTNLLTQIPSQILVQQQKQRMIQMLQSLQTSNFQQSRKTVRLFDKMIVLMNRRMNNAHNRTANIII